MSLITVFYMAITIFLIIFGFFIKKSKFLYFIQMFWMWILIAFNNGGADYRVHLNIYNASVNSDINLLNGSSLYFLLCKIFYQRGFHFISLNILLSTFICIYLYIFIKSKSKNPCFAVSLFYLYPLADCIIQKRWFLANTIILIGLDILLKNTKKIKNICIFFVFLVIAYQIHVAAIIYIILGILVMMPEEKIRKIMFIFIIGAYSSIPIIPSIAALFFPKSKVQLYFEILRLGFFDFFAWTFFNLSFVFLFWLIYKYYGFDNSNKISKDTYALNRGACVYLPLYYYEPTFIRFYRGILLYNYICISNIQPKNSIYKKNVLICTIIGIAESMAAFVFIYIITGMGFDKLVLPIFENNIVLNLLR